MRSGPVAEQIFVGRIDFRINHRVESIVFFQRYVLKTPVQAGHVCLMG